MASGSLRGREVPHCGWGRDRGVPGDLQWPGARLPRRAWADARSTAGRVRDREHGGDDRQLPRQPVLGVSAPGGGRSGRGRLAFFVINLASMVIPLGCLAFTRYALGRSDPFADNIAANVVGLALGTAASFWALRLFIFLTPRPVEPLGLADSAPTR